MFDIRCVWNWECRYSLWNKKDAEQEDICDIISNICKELHKGSGAIYVYFVNEEFIIMDNNVTIGNVTASEKKYGILLKFKWKE